MPLKKYAFVSTSILLFLLFFSLTLSAQQSVSGKIIGKADNQPVIGATVKVDGANSATQTGPDGSFTVTSKKTITTLIISAIGFETQRVPVNGAASLSTISLAVSTSSLNDVVVVGYTAQKKKDITGAVTVVDVKSLKAQPAANPDQLLQGQAAGIQVISSGQPGAAAQINIRGIASFSNNDPLYIIDGVQGAFHDVNPDDIESIQVLKDAGAAAIYGIQGANGVIIVTTKKGKSGKSVISYDGWYSAIEPLGGNPFHLLNAAELMKVNQILGTNTALYTTNYVLPDYTYNNNGNTGIGNEGDPAVAPSKYVFTPDHSADYLIMKVNKAGTDWFHEDYKPNHSQNHTITASGGNEKSTYLFSLNYTDQNGTLQSNFLKRYSVRINSTTSVKKNIRVGENVYVFYKQNPLSENQWEGAPSREIYYAQPAVPVYDIAGNFAGSYDGPGLGNGDNPVADLVRFKQNRYNTWDVIGNVYGEVDILKHFTVRSVFGGTIDNQYSYNFNPTPYEQFESHNLANNFSEQAQYNDTWLWTNTLAYSNVFAEKHSVKILIGSEANSYSGRGVGGSSSNFSPTLASNPSYWILNNGTANITNYSYGNQTALYSLFGRLDYAYNDKYLIGATVRRDGASVLASAVRYTTFPSVSLGWRISGEDFMKSVTWINELKLRASWGKLGSIANVSAANSINTFGQAQASSYYDINGTSTSSVPGYYQIQVGNAGTTWEADKVENLGLDASLFGNKVDFTAEYFEKSISGLLAPYIYPATAAQGTFPFLNAANTQNKGFELTAAYHGIVNRDFKFNIGLNFTSYRNKVLSIPSPGYIDAGGSRQGNLVRNLPGHPIGSFYGYKVIGLYKDSNDVVNSPTETDAGPGRFKYADISGPNGKPDGVIDANDRTQIGNPNPKFTYGLNLSASYKNWDFSAFFYGSYGNQVYNEGRYWTDFYGSFAGNKSKDLLYNSWTPSNLNAKTPKIETSGYNSTNNVANSYFIESGSFLKLKSLKIAYNLPVSKIKGYGIDRLTFYIQAVNLFTITKYTGLDPELITGGSANGANPTYASTASFGIDYGNYPNNERSYVFGVNLSF
jgi:TonB-linked SusC/RagA family outer membrane protein